VLTQIIAQIPLGLTRHDMTCYLAYANNNCAVPITVLVVCLLCRS